MDTLKSYYELAKPGIIYGNALTAAAGFFLASKGNIDWWLFAAMLVGLSLVIGAACVFNNYIDRDIDDRMERTKKRATVTGIISPKATLMYGSFLLVFGILMLYFFTNVLTLFVALVGVVSYVAIYTPLKRRTIHSTLVGSIAGATPPVVGFCAVTHILNTEALILFLILFFWELPHFYAIAIYRGNEYTAAAIPTLPRERGLKEAKIYILVYIIAFFIAAASLTFLGFTGKIYLAIVLLLGMTWLWFALRGFQSTIDTTRWARQIFLFSLAVIAILSITLSLSVLLP
jgi:protoheme IX farnesyltransferase